MMIASELESKIKILVESLGFGLYEILNVKENENQILFNKVEKMRKSMKPIKEEQKKESIKNEVYDDIDDDMILSSDFMTKKDK